MKRYAEILFQASLVCAVLAIPLASLDVCTWWTISYFPERPSYLVALAGVFFWFLSGHWYREAPRHKALLVCVLIALLWSTFATVCGSLERKPGHLTFDYLLLYLNWRVWPLVFLIWMALAFSELQHNRIVKLLSLSLLLLFLPNLIHEVLEILANAGTSGVKDFLVNINPFFRKAKANGGWWPPVFFEGRVRGLFAEPSYMGFSLLPLFGYFVARLRKSWLYGLPLAALFVIYGCSKTYSGLLGVTAFLIFLVILNDRLPRRMRWSVAGCVCGLGMLLLVGWFAFGKQTDLGRNMAREFHNIERLSSYCVAINAGQHPAVPKLDYRKTLPSSAGPRLTAIWLDITTALHAPLVGTGFYQRGFFLLPLAACDFQGTEFGLWMRQATASPFRVVPQISEYTVLMAEFGFPGLFFFLLLYGFIGKQALRFSQKNNDYFLFCMTCSYCAMLVSAMFVSLINVVLFFYFSGILYALSKPSMPISSNRTGAVPERMTGSRPSMWCKYRCD